MLQEWREKMKIRVKKLDEHAVLPTRGSVDAAGYDLYVKTTEDTVIPPHETVMIGTGLAMEIPQGYFGAIFARSGLACKSGLRPGKLCRRGGFRLPRRIYHRCAQ